MLRWLIVAVMLAIPTLAQAQGPVNALKTCVTDNTSGRDRKDLAKWVFFAMAAHPEMKPYADAKVAAAVDESSQKMAALVTRLLTESCVNEVRAVMKTGQGSQALRFAFESLGQLAMQELMADKTVQDTMGLFQRYVDQTRLKEALADK
jgi:hypothetical protein